MAIATARRSIPYSWRRCISHLCHRNPDGVTRRQIMADLERHVSSAPGPSFLFLPTHSFYSSNFNRPQQMALALAGSGSPAVYAEPWAGGGSSGEQNAVGQANFVGVRPLAENLSLLHVPTWLLRDYVAQNVFDCLVMIWPHQAGYIMRGSQSLVVYEMVDDHALVPRTTLTWRLAHRRWVARADVVTAITSRLLVPLRTQRPDAILLPNGVRPEDFALASGGQMPADMAEPRKAPVVVIYYGSIGDPWFDWDLWNEAAARLPDWSFVLIGYPYGCKEEDIVRQARERRNVFYLGCKPYAELAAYLANADVATIPFLLNDVTHACSPLKLFEYMAAGKPIVATAMREILGYRSVLVADGPTDFVGCLQQAAGRRDDPEYLATLQSEAEANTWHARAHLLREAVAAAKNRQHGLPRRKLKST